MKIFLTTAEKVYGDSIDLIDDILFPQKVHWIKQTYKNAKTGLVYPPHKLAERLFTSELVGYVRENPCKKTAFLLAGGNQIFGGEGRKFSEDNLLHYQYKVMPLSLSHIYAGRTAALFGEVQYVATDATACASSLKVMMDVRSLIGFYGFDRVVVLALEDQVNNMTLQFFGEAGASLTEKMAAEAQALPSAFDNKNFGFYIGQGAAIAVFESEYAVGKKPLAELVGAWTASESDTHAIGQREDGQGFKNAILGVCENSKIESEQIKIVKTHGTGTPSNNVAEKRALTETLVDFVATSYKQRIGHTMGASGLLETLLLLDDLNGGFVPEILNRTEEDAVFLSSAKQAPEGLILSLAAGMGNVYSAAVFNREV